MTKGLKQRISYIVLGVIIALLSTDNSKDWLSDIFGIGWWKISYSVFIIFILSALPVMVFYKKRENSMIGKIIYWFATRLYNGSKILSISLLIGLFYFTYGLMIPLAIHDAWFNITDNIYNMIFISSNLIGLEIIILGFKHLTDNLPAMYITSNK